MVRRNLKKAAPASNPGAESVAPPFAEDGLAETSVSEDQPSAVPDSDHFHTVRSMPSHDGAVAEGVDAYVPPRGGVNQSGTGDGRVVRRQAKPHDGRPEHSRGDKVRDKASAMAVHRLDQMPPHVWAWFNTMLMRLPHDHVSSISVVDRPWALAELFTWMDYDDPKKQFISTPQKACSAIAGAFMRAGEGVSLAAAACADLTINGRTQFTVRDLNVAERMALKSMRVIYPTHESGSYLRSTGDRSPHSQLRLQLLGADPVPTDDDKRILYTDTLIINRGGYSFRGSRK